MSRISPRLMTVWQRNWDVYRRTWQINFLPPLLEPILYVVAFGFGFRAMIGNVTYQGVAVSYVTFIAPALIAVGIMYNAFFESTYSSYVRMYYQKTFDAMLATPLSLEDVIGGEIVWSATKSVIAAAVMLAVLSAFGLIRYPQGLLILPLAFLGGLAFGAIGMIFTGIVKNIEMFNLPVFLFVTPMFLFSGTFFPLDTLPAWAQQVALVFPLTHLVTLVRALAFGLPWHGDLGWACAYLIVFAGICVPLALRAMRRRLIH